MNYCKVDSYSKHRHVQHDIAMQTLSLLDGHWKAGDAVLDVVCGTGNETKMIAEMDNVSSVTGVDILPQMIKYAKTHSMITGKMEYLRGDVCTLVEDHPQLYNRFTKNFNGGVYLYSESPVEFAENVKTIGFTDVLCYSDDVIIKMHSTEAVKDFIKPILGQLTVIPPNQHDDFLHDWLHEFDIIISYDGSETRIWNHPSLFVWARK
ncbi:malonyl-[acyl-carrier protein] O-methyltransferase-like [Saccoglossus kowalevskii]